MSSKETLNFYELRSWDFARMYTEPNMLPRFIASITEDDKDRLSKYKLGLESEKQRLENVPDELRREESELIPEIKLACLSNLDVEKGGQDAISWIENLISIQKEYEEPLSISDEVTELIKRYSKLTSAKRRYKRESSQIILFQEEVRNWKETVLAMLDHLKKPQIERFLNVKPILEPNWHTSLDSSDYSDFITYFAQRRDIEKCSTEEMVCLARLSTLIQKCCEFHINPLNFKPRIMAITEETLRSFVTIDFETATPDRNSPCELALAFVENGEVTGSRSWRIKPIQYPNFNYYNVQVHGITANDVANAPTFDEIWPEVLPLLENKLVIAHNAAFDFSVLRQTLDAYNTPYPSLRIVCSYILSKKVWKNLDSYSLGNLCALHNIDLIHHQAESDAVACAKLSLLAFETAGISTESDFKNKLKMSVGSLDPDGYKGSKSARVQSKKPSLTTSEPTVILNDNSIFTGRHVAFTGTLQSMTRTEAEQLILQVGGFNDSTIKSTTNFLVIGTPSEFLFRGEEKSSKHRKVEELAAKGREIEVLTEQEFLQNL